MKLNLRFWNLLVILTLAASALALPAQSASADGTVQTLPFTQNWTNTGLITAANDWSGVTGIMGYRGDGLTATTGTDPQTILADDSPGVVTLAPNQTNPLTYATGGVAEFELADPVVALTGSSTADAPYLLLSINTTGMETIHVSYAVRDIEAGTDDAIQQVALHYRVGSAGSFTNVPAAFVADATVPGNVQSTPVSVTLPPAANNQAVVQLRVMTTNAIGNDEWVGIDDISITGTPVGDPVPTVTATTPLNGATGVAFNADLSVTFSELVNVAAGFFTISCSASGTHAGIASSADSLTYTINPSADFWPTELCTVTLENTLVTEQAGSGRPMAADYSWSFTTAPGSAVCGDPFTPIYAIQGSGATAAITGTVATQGIVVGDNEGASPALQGYFIQDLTGDANPASSDGIFVYSSSGLDTVHVGEVVRVTGTAGEYQGQTQITVSTVAICSLGATIAPTDVTLPLPSATYLERYEGMLVRLPQTMYVTGNSLLGRFGEVVLSPMRLPQPTNVVAPGATALALQAQNDLNRILMDDSLNNEYPDPIYFGQGGEWLAADNPLRSGDSASNIVGLMTYTWSGNSISGNAYRLRPINAMGGGFPAFIESSNARPNDQAWLPPSRLRVATLNTQNYFNTFGAGACMLGAGGAATDCRGASNQTEFDRQWPKLVQAVLATGADVIGLMELENDGYGTGSAIQDLVDRLNTATAPGTYAFINADALTGQTNVLGTDAIKVGFVYRPATVTPVGTTAALNSTAFVNGGDTTARNRPALAQAFQEVSTGSRFIAVANHLKSKDSACDTPDAGDGQGNCNLVRTNAANALATWLAGNPTGTGDGDVLILGDLNAYAMEDPITAIQNAGYTNLISQYNGVSAYTYGFDGQWGYLDHALATANLVTQVTGAVTHHINADEPSVLDYNTENKTAGQLVSLYAADKYRAADHDPVVIGLNLNHDPVAIDLAWTTNEDTALSEPLTASDLDNDPLTYALGTAPAHGTVNIIAATGVFTYTPASNYFGLDSFTFVVSDGRGGTDTGTISLTIYPLNDNPVALAQSLFVDQNSVLNGTLTATDVDGDTLTYGIALAPVHGVITSYNTATGAFSYTPTTGFLGSDSFTFDVSDGHSGNSIAVISITVRTPNVSPVAGDQSLTTNEDTALDGTVTATDGNGDPITFARGISPSHGTLIFNNTTGAFTYTPALNYNGPDSFTFVANDDRGGSDSGTVSITVSPVNDAPVAGDQTLTTNEDIALNGTLTASDVDGDSLSYTQLVGPAHGTLNITAATGAFTYTPAANYNGPDSFTFTVNDGHSGTDTGQINITVTSVNDLPVAGDQSLTTNEDTPLNGTLTATDVDGDTLTYTQLAAPSHGTLSITAATGAFTYTPAANYHGPDSFTFTVSDGHSGTDTGQINITVTSVNDLPVAGDQSLTTNEDTLLNGTLTATDVDEDTLTYSQTIAPAHGTLSITAATGAFTYTPTANYHGPDSFTFTVNDGHSGTDTGVISITVTSVNDLPVAGDQNLSTAEDTALTGTLTASDADGDTLTYSQAIAPGHGSLTITAGTGAFTYTPAANYHGPDSFTFTVNDGHGGTDTGVISITVTSVNDLPVAGDQSLTTNEDTVLNGTLTASDVDGDTLTYTQLAAPSHGTLNITGSTGAFTYTPAANYHGLDSFTFTVSDGHGGTDTGQINITVTSVNDLPVAGDQTLTTNEDTPLNGTLTATDADGDTLTYAQSIAPLHGTLNITASTGAFTYTPAANYHGPDSFTFSVNDGHGGSDTGLISITVASVNDLPVAGDQNLSTAEDTALNGTLTATDVESTVFTFVQATCPAHGTLNITPATGAFTYTPAANYHGPDSFTFTVTDGDGGSDVGAVTIMVTSVPDPPIAADQSINVTEDVAFEGTVTAFDGDGDVLTFAVDTQPLHGTLSLTASTGAFTYTPVAGYNGPDSFIFTASDGTSSDSGTVTITVAPANDPPVAADQTLAMDEDTPLTGTVSATDVDGDTLSYTVGTAPAHGTVNITAATGAFTYTPAANYHGPDSFTFTASDGSLSDTGTVEITVNPVNDVPLAPVISNVIWQARDAHTYTIPAFTDADGDPLAYTVTLAGGALPAWLSFDEGTLAFSGTPQNADVGDYLIKVAVDDGQGGTAETTFTLSVVLNAFKIFLPVIGR